MTLLAKEKWNGIPITKKTSLTSNNLRGSNQAEPSAHATELFSSPFLAFEFFQSCLENSMRGFLVCRNHRRSLRLALFVCKSYSVF